MHVAICSICNNYWMFHSKSRYFQLKFQCSQCNPDIYEEFKKRTGLAYAKRRQAMKARQRAVRKRPWSRFPVCEKCGDVRHSIHHIKPISSFPISATCAEINHKANIIVLCDSCHKKAHEV